MNSPSLHNDVNIQLAGEHHTSRLEQGHRVPSQNNGTALCTARPILTLIFPSTPRTKVIHLFIQVCCHRHDKREIRSRWLCGYAPVLLSLEGLAVQIPRDARPCAPPFPSPLLPPVRISKFVIRKKSTMLRPHQALPISGRLAP